MDVTDSDEVPVRVTGALMSNYVKSKAILIGFVTRTDPDGKRITLKTTDGEYIQVVFTTPLNFVLQPNQLIEAYGTIMHPNLFECTKFSHFQPEVSSEFDSEMYKQFIPYFMKYKNRVNITEPVDVDQEPVLNKINHNVEVDWGSLQQEDPESILDATLREFDS